MSLEFRACVGNGDLLYEFHQYCWVHRCSGKDKAFYFEKQKESLVLKTKNKACF